MDVVILTPLVEKRPFYAIKPNKRKVYTALQQASVLTSVRRIIGNVLVLFLQNADYVIHFQSTQSLVGYL